MNIKNLQLRIGYLLFNTIFISVTIISCQTKTNNEAEYVVYPSAIVASDSLIITNDEMISDPFGLGDSLLTYLSSNMEIDTIETIADTLEILEEDTATNQLAGIYYQINCKGNHFSIYKRTDGAELFDYAKISTADFPTRRGFYIGMSKAEFIKKLNISTVTTIPGHLLIADEDEGYYRFHFEFRNDKLTKIDYDGYLD